MTSDDAVRKTRVDSVQPFSSGTLWTLWNSLIVRPFKKVFASSFVRMILSTTGWKGMIEMGFKEIMTINLNWEINDHAYKYLTQGNFSTLQFQKRWRFSKIWVTDHFRYIIKIPTWFRDLGEEKQNKSSRGWGLNNTLLSFSSCNPTFQLPFTQNILRTFWGGLHDKVVACDLAFSGGFLKESGDLRREGKERKRGKGKKLVSFPFSSSLIHFPHKSLVFRIDPNKHSNKIGIRIICLFASLEPFGSRFIEF